MGFEWLGWCPVGVVLDALDASRAEAELAAARPLGAQRAGRQDEARLLLRLLRLLVARAACALGWWAGRRGGLVGAAARGRGGGRGGRGGRAARVVARALVVARTLLRGRRQARAVAVARARRWCRGEGRWGLERVRGRLGGDRLGGDGAQRARQLGVLDLEARALALAHDARHHAAEPVLPPHHAAFAEQLDHRLAGALEALGEVGAAEGRGHHRTQSRLRDGLGAHDLLRRLLRIGGGPIVTEEVHLERMGLRRLVGRRLSLARSFLRREPLRLLGRLRPHHRPRKGERGRRGARRWSGRAPG